MFFFRGFKALTDYELGFAAWELFRMDSIPISIEERTVLFSGIERYLFLIRVKCKMEEEQPCSLSTLLWTFRDQFASDPPDKIYSLFSLSRNSTMSDDSEAISSVSNSRLDTKDILLDYRASVEDAYINLVEATVNQIKSLNIICAC